MIRPFKKYFFIALISSLLAGCFSGSGSDSPDANSSATPANTTSTSSISFSTHQLVVTPTRTVSVTITNTGNTNLNNLVISLSPQITGQIIPGTCSTELMPQASCDVSIKADDNIAANQSGLLTVEATGLTPTSLPTQVIVPNLTVSNTNIDNSGPFTITLTNNNPVDAVVNSVNVQTTSGAGINYDHTDCTSNPIAKDGGTCTIYVNVLPNATGQAQLTIRGNYPQINASLSINNVAVTATNSVGTPLANVVINPNSNQTITFTNNGNFAVQNLNLTTPTLTNVSILRSVGCNNLLPHASCNVSLSAGATPTGTGNIILTGDNITAGSINIPVNTLTPGQDVAFTPMDRSAQAVGQRGLKYAQIQVSNQSPYAVSLTSISSNLSNVILANDSLHAPSSGCALNDSIPSLGSCRFWIVSSNNADVGTQNGTLNINYTLNGNPNTETLNLSVESDLYMYGTFSTRPNTCFNGAVPGTCQNLAKWNGTQWQTVGGQPTIGTSFDNVNSMVLDQNGNIDFITTAQPFMSISGNLINHLASWDGVSWGNFGGGLSSDPVSAGNIYQALSWNNTNPNNPVLYFAYDNFDMNSFTSTYALGSWSASTGVNQLAYNFGSQQLYSLAYDATSNKVYIGSTGSDPNILYTGTPNLSSIMGIMGISSTLGQTNQLLFNGSNLYLSGYFVSNADNNTYLLDTYNTANNAIQSTNLYNPADTNPAALQGNLLLQEINNSNLYFTSDYNSNQISCGIFSAPQSNPNNATLLASNTLYGGCFYRPNALVITDDNTYYAAGNFPQMTPASSSTINTNCLIKKTAAGTWMPLSNSIGPSNNINDMCGIASTFQASLLMVPTLTVSN